MKQNKAKECKSGKDIHDAAGNNKYPLQFSMLTIINNGQDIADTNYWDSDMAKDGNFFLSWNAGAARLLVPDSLKSTIYEMQTGNHVVISRGPWAQQNERDALELMFDDFSDRPFFITICTEQTDRLTPYTDQNSDFDIVLWTRDGEHLRLPGKYRVVDQLPCLKAWVEPTYVWPIQWGVPEILNSGRNLINNQGKRLQDFLSLIMAGDYGVYGKVGNSDKPQSHLCREAGLRFEAAYVVADKLLYFSVNENGRTIVCDFSDR